MSWSASASSVPPGELDQALKTSFEGNHSEPAPGVKEQFEAALEIKDELFRVLHETELVSASLNGHAKQGDQDWGASLAISVTAHG